MNTREILTKDIKAYLSNAVELHNLNKSVEKNEYFNLQLRIQNMNELDFDSKEKYLYFLDYLNEPRRVADRYFIKNFLTNENNLEIGSFLFMCNDLDGIVNWLN